MSEELCILEPEWVCCLGREEAQVFAFQHQGYDIFLYVCGDDSQVTILRRPPKRKRSFFGWLFRGDENA